MDTKFWFHSIEDEFIKLFDRKYIRVYRGNYDEWKACELIINNAVIIGKDCYFDRLLFEYCLYRDVAAAMRTGPFDCHKDTFIIVIAAAFYVLEVKGTDRYIEPVLTVLDNLRDDGFFTYSKRDYNEYVFTAAQIAGTQATAYALEKLDICQKSETDGFEL